jgi:hypothetical protein
MADPYTIALEYDVPTQELAYKIGFIIIRSIHEVLSGDRTGRWYPTPGNLAYDRLTPKDKRAENYHAKFTGARTRDEIVGSAYRASAPGEPPAARTGRLRQSFFMTIIPHEDYWTLRIFTNVTYADDLEYGTERMAPRPFIVPALERAKPQIEEEYVLHFRILVGRR